MQATGSGHFGAGRREEALAAYQKSLAIRENLATAESGAQLPRDLSLLRGSPGEEEAVTRYLKSLAMGQKLTAADPGNTEWQRDLSVNHEKIGGMLAISGKREEALGAYQK